MTKKKNPIHADCCKYVVQAMTTHVKEIQASLRDVAGEPVHLGIRKRSLSMAKQVLDNYKTTGQIINGYDLNLLYEAEQKERVE